MDFHILCSVMQEIKNKDNISGRVINLFFQSSEQELHLIAVIALLGNPETSLSG